MAFLDAQMLIKNLKFFQKTFHMGSVPSFKPQQYRNLYLKHRQKRGNFVPFYDTPPPPIASKKMLKLSKNFRLTGEFNRGAYKKETVLFR